MPNMLYRRTKVEAESVARFDANRAKDRLQHEAPEGLMEVTEQWMVRQSEGMGSPGAYLYSEKRSIRVRLGDVLTPESLAAQTPPFCYYGKRPGVEVADRVESIEIEMFWTNRSGGYAIARDFWPGKFRYFRFGCQHNDVSSTSGGRCYVHYRCKDCGHSWSIDSGD